MKESFKHWRANKATRLAAAIAYYAVFSLGPILFILLTIVGTFFSEQTVRRNLISNARQTAGDAVANLLQTILENVSPPSNLTLAAVAGIVVLIFGATSLFAHLHDALNTVWEVTRKPRVGFLATVKSRLLAFLMIIVVGTLLLVELVLNSLLATLGRELNNASVLPGVALLWQVSNYLLTYALVTLLFATVYKVLPDVKIAWSDVWVGSLVTALLFSIGQILFGVYLAYSNVGSTYGAAGSVVVLLLWVFYSSLILLFGAELTQVYARKYGGGLHPEDNAMRVTGTARSQEGLSPHKETHDRVAGDKQAERVNRGKRHVRASPWFR